MVIQLWWQGKVNMSHYILMSLRKQLSGLLTSSTLHHHPLPPWTIYTHLPACSHILLLRLWPHPPSCCSPTSSDCDPNLPPTADPPSVQPVLYPACWQNTQDTEHAGQEQQEGQVHGHEYLVKVIDENNKHSVPGVGSSDKFKHVRVIFVLHTCCPVSTQYPPYMTKCCHSWFKSWNRLKFSPIRKLGCIWVSY